MGKSYKLEKLISVIILSLTLVLVKSKKSELFGIENDDLQFVLLQYSIYKIDKVPLSFCIDQVSSPCCSFL